MTLTSPATTPATPATPSARAARQAEVVQALLQHLPAHTLLWHSEDTTPYECDGLTAYRQRPLVVALPETTAQVQAVLQACH
ncbi:MAG: FAD-binding oxidoreductase, partial [Burkholderiaceae bacterium]|nr:FAD-binding oxidoreductase [Burkholderiaceae bacterium]